VITRPCFACGASIEGEDLGEFGLVGLAHVRAEHFDEVPFPDMAVRNFFEGEARMTGSAERLPTIGSVEVHRVTDDRIDDWLAFFDFDMAVGTPQNSGCYCLEPHEVAPGQPLPEFGHWTKRRAAMVERLRDGTTVGYLAYVDGHPAGWVNASMRGDYALFRRDDQHDRDTIGVACFAIAPPYRGHGIAARLLERVVAEASARGAGTVEAYPLNGVVAAGSGFRGSRRMYDDAGFAEVRARARDTVVRRSVRPASARRRADD
jgi:GNAT superfamily N-acetyltransferase